MIFTSYTYLLFLTVIFVCYWLIPTIWRKTLLVGASYFFYCTWDWRFGFLLLGVSLFNWGYGRWLAGHQDAAYALAGGILVNLGPLIYFKYTGFILGNIASIVIATGGTWQFDIPQIILPLGISFFSFQGIAYLIDVWSGEKPLVNLRDFLLYKAFWPQLIAGPIIRPHEIADQILTARRLSYENLAVGCQRIIYGFFKKVVIADSLANYVDAVFRHGATPNFVDAVCGALGFGLQIYLDFSAYSDIAIGSARLFGYTFPENFNWPYAAHSPQEFWNRWHMTLSRWIRDYVFSPIQFATRSYKHTTLLWLLVAMAICGLWHGAQWTFVAWGCWHGLLLVLNQTLMRNLFVLNRKKLSSIAYNVKFGLGLVLTFILVNLGWVLFRAQNISDAYSIYRVIFSFKGGLRPAILRENTILFIVFVVLSLGILQITRTWIEQYLTAEQTHPLHVSVRAMVYTLMIVAVVIFDTSSRAFVYFQF
jgi:D-alanyl-lipoteichoic acid acyltransferase DltB (MBOAT superfamily)